ncbi:MAG: hypothetical protein Q9227_000972 [Pyrenula ochraceoflavens]
MAAEVDVRRIASFASFPESSVQTVLDSPTSELVQSLLRAISGKVQEHEQLKAEKLRSDIELESSVRSNESKVKVLKNSVEKGLGEVSKLRTELQISENARANLESEIEQVKKSTNQDASETATLRSRISSLEASNRDTLAVLESKSSAYDKVAEELATQNQKGLEFRRQISTLESNLQSANSAAAAKRYKEENLEREIELLKKNSDWFESELQTKSNEYAKFRKERAARITELQSLNEQYASEADSLRRSEASLKAQLEDQNQKFEDSLQTIQTLREEAIQNADNTRVELENASRLAELQQASANSAKRRAQELTNSLDEVRDELAAEVGHLRAELDTEILQKQAAEQKAAEVESRLSVLEAEVELSRNRAITPQPDLNGHGFSSPVRPGTPSGGLLSSIFSPRSSRGKGGSMTMTQLYGEYKKLEKQYASEQRQNQQLTATIDDMVQELEQNKPDIDEIRSDRNRLEAELTNMSSMLDEANREKTTAVKDSRKWQGQVEGLIREGDILRQQLRDLSAQVKVLLMEQHLRENGQEMSREEIDELQQTASLSENDLSGLNDTGRLISQQLTTFKNISQLQEQNVELERLIRELGNQMENSEARAKERISLKAEEELQATKAQLEVLTDEYKSAKALIESFRKERDMFKGLATRKSGDPSLFSRSMPLPGGTTGPQDLGNSLQGSPGPDADYGKALRELQQNFDRYREESGTDHTALKNQVNELSKKNGQLQNEAARTLSQLSAANQRTELLQGNFNMLKTENSELQKRSYAAMESANKQEVKIQQTAEDLVGAKGLVDSVQRENANLKAEKDLWKSVEARLIEDNESLRNERSRLDNLNSSLQNILTEREHSDSETRRRLQSNIESLEAELQSTKRKLNDEVEESKKAALRREYDNEQNQKKINDLLASSSSFREELASVKTSRDHLQARVDELVVELRSAEERLNVLSTKNAPAAEPDSTSSAENRVTHEQELAIEVSELKRDFELKVGELERANEQVEDYKGISQASEERLQELSENSEQYREESERLLNERDARIKNLEQRAEDISAELSTTNNELSALRDEHSEAARHLEDQKSIFEAEISRLKDQDERHAAAAQFHQEDLKAQANIAQQAQENYEAELVKHAEAAKALQTVRTELNDVKLQAADFRTQAETVRTDLSQKEASWTELKGRYEREISDLKRRREEISHQNDLLHQQLENVTKQVSALRQDRAALSDGNNGGAELSFDLESNQETINFLRQEKEIVEIRFSQLETESKRLRQQLTSTVSQLDDAKLQLEQRRLAAMDTERNALNHKKLMDTLNELNLYRESSVTLRQQTKLAETSLAEKSQLVDELTAQIEPLNIRIGELENMAEAREGEMKLLQEDRDRWQKRTQDILSKYDRVDPAELQELKDKVSSIEAERDEVTGTRDALQAQVESFPEQIEATKKDLRERLGEQFKGRSKQLSERINQKQADLEAANVEKTRLEAELETVKSELDNARNKQSPKPIEVNGTQETVNTTTDATNDASSARIEELEGTVVGLESTIAEKEQQIAQLNEVADARFKTKENELKAVLNKRLADVKMQAEKARENALKELEEKIKAEHQKEIEALRSDQNSVTDDAGTAKPAATTDPIGDALSLLTDLPEEQTRKLIQGNEILRGFVRKNVQVAVQKEREKMKQEMDVASNTQTDSSVSNGSTEDFEKKLAAEKETIIEEQVQKFSTEKDALIKDLESRFSAEKEAIIEEQQQIRSQEALTFSEEAQKKIAAQVDLAEKKSLAKLNLHVNQKNQLKARLDVVQEAATNTPEKPVKEVWDVAKIAKPSAAAAQGQAKPPPATPTATQQNVSDQINSPAKPSPAKTASPTTNAVKAPQQAEEQQTNLVKPSQNNQAGTGPAALRALQSGLPRGRGTGRGSAAAQATQPHQQPSQPATQEGQPAQPGSAQGARGSAIPRGAARGGRAGARAGAQNVQTGLPQPSAGTQGQHGGTNSPRGNLNPQAKQFNPAGMKRPREGEVGEGGNGGKRPRGGSQGS